MLHQLARGWGKLFHRSKNQLYCAGSIHTKKNSLQIKIIEYIQQEISQMIVDTRLI